MVLGIVVVLAAAAWWGRSWFSGGPPAPTVEVDTVRVDDPPPGTTEGVVAMEPFEPLPTLAESDEWLREEAAELSPDPRWPTWLDNPAPSRSRSSS